MINLSPKFEHDIRTAAVGQQVFTLASASFTVWSPKRTLAIV